MPLMTVTNRDSDSDRDCDRDSDRDSDRGSDRDCDCDLFGNNGRGLHECRASFEAAFTWKHLAQSH